MRPAPLLHHIELNVRDLDASFVFYERFFDFLGQRDARRSAVHFAFYFEGFYLYVNQCRPETAGRRFHRYDPGLNHLAFRAPDRAHVDAWHAVLLANAVPVLDPPAFYGERYYAVYFEDPDGMKLELGCNE